MTHNFLSKEEFKALLMRGDFDAVNREIRKLNKAWEEIIPEDMHVVDYIDHCMMASGFPKRHLDCGWCNEN